MPLKSMRVRIYEEIAGNIGDVDLERYYKAHEKNTKWLDILKRFPEGLQKEIIVERPDGEQRDIEEIDNFRLLSKEPVLKKIKDLLKNPTVLEDLSNTPQKILDIINKQWGTNLKEKEVYDKNPGRYLQYSQMPASTQKPSVMVNGKLYWGVGRFIASLLRGDETIKIWELKTK